MDVTSATNRTASQWCTGILWRSPGLIFSRVVIPIASTSRNPPISTRPPAQDWRQPRFLIAGVAAALLFLAAYSNSLRNAFHFDDSSVLVDNIFIRDIGNIPLFFRDAITHSAFPTNAMYRPLISTTYAFDYWRGGGLDPMQFHLTQLTLFLAVGVLLYFIYVRLFAGAASGKANRWLALFAATLFCVHTGNSQVGNWIHARSELLSGLGILGSFLLYIHKPAWRRYYLYAIPMAIGAFAKTPAVIFAPLLLAYVVLIERQLPLRDVVTGSRWAELRGALISTAPVFVLGAGLYMFIESMNGPAQAYSNIGRVPYLMTQTWAWVRYVTMFFVPTGLSADSDMQLITTLADPRAIAGILLLAASVFAVWRTSLSRELRPVAFGITWFWIALLPASSVFPLSELTNDHRPFLPFMGLTPAIVWWIAVRLRSLRLPPVITTRLPLIATSAVIVILATHALATHQRNKVWRTGESLWADVAKKSPRNGRGLMNYGLTQMHRGRNEVAKELFFRAYELTPNYPVLHVNIAIVTNALGDSVAAEEWFKRAIATDPGYPGGHRFYAGWLRDHGRAPEAIPHLERAVQLSPADISARQSLLELYAAQGDSARLRASVRELLRINSADPIASDYMRWLSGNPGGSATEWYEQGLRHTRSNRHAAAAVSYRISLTLDPANPDALNNFGWSLGKLGFFEEAVPVLEQAVRLSPGSALAQSNLEWARSLGR